MMKVHSSPFANSTMSFLMAGSSAHDHGHAGSVWYATMTMAAENTGRGLSNAPVCEPQLGS